MRGIRRTVASLVPWLAVCVAPEIAGAQHIAVDRARCRRRRPCSTGPNYSIGSNLGKQVGGNLFQSFGLFGLTQGETATFSGPATVTNIIGRVTGGTQSSIDGTITSAIPKANLYLINPSGVVFGPNATVNVSGSFYASTGDYIRMSDGARFQATNPGGSTFSAAAPTAFGFLNTAPPAITFNGSTLAVNPGQTLGLVGGPVTIDNGATLAAPSGTIHVTSAAGTGEVPVDPTNVSALTVASFGAVSIAGGSTLDVSDPVGKTSGGSIYIKSGTLTISDGGFLDGTNYGTGAGGVISLYGASQIALSGGAVIHAPAIGSGSGANITLTTGSAGSISASAQGTTLSGNVLVDVGNGVGASGAAGSLTVTTGTLSLTGDAIFGSDAQGSGNAGPISITANSITIDGTASSSVSPLTGIRSVTLAGAANAADITVNTGTLTIRGNGEIVTNTFGAGNAGHVSVAVTGDLSIDATGATVSTGIGSVASPGSTGNAGDITITAASLSMVGSSSVLLPSPAAVGSNPFAGLSAQTFSSGNGGSISLNLGGGPLAMSNGAVISSSTSGTGQGGALDIAAQGSLLMRGAGTAITASSTGSGDAGSIMVSGLNLKIGGGAAISTEAATANGGNIALAVGDFLYLVDSEITTSV